MAEVNSYHLCEALLAQAVDDLVFDPTPGDVEAYIHSVRGEAYSWFMDTRKDVGSFEWICRRLELDPETLREKARTLHERPRQYRYTRRWGPSSTVPETG